jgi:mono/diheme cytochrome c family protein
MRQWVNRFVVVACLALSCALGCRKQDMAEQPSFRPLEPSSFFVNGMSARPLVEGTVPRGARGPIIEPLYAVTTGLNQPEATTFPFQMTAADLTRGQEQFNIFCAPCHGRLGDANGMIVQRGFPRPPSYYLPRLRNAPPGHFYNVITHGLGAMYSYSERVSPEDRWRIVAYIRALQASDPNNNGQSPPLPPPANRTEGARTPE